MNGTQIPTEAVDLLDREVIVEREQPLHKDPDRLGFITLCRIKARVVGHTAGWVVSYNIPAVNMNGAWWYNRDAAGDALEDFAAIKL